MAKNYGLPGPILRHLGWQARGRVRPACGQLKRISDACDVRRGSGPKSGFQPVASVRESGPFPGRLRRMPPVNQSAA